MRRKGVAAIETWLTSGRALCAALACAASLAAAEPAPNKPPPHTLPTGAKLWKGDFDGMLKRRHIRVLVPYSRSLYYNDRGRERGITADHVREFERFVNRKYAKELRNRPITVYMIPTTRDELIQDVANGEGDIAAGNLTVTEARTRVVDFVAPARQKPVSEVVVTAAGAPPVTAAEELSGRTVHVRKASSYHESLIALNGRLGQAGRPFVKVVLVDDALEDEDLMEMVNAGLLEAIVVDDWKALMWARALPKIRVNEGAALRSGGRFGWAIRKGSPRLARLLEEFHADWARTHGDRHRRIAQYAGRVRQLQDPTRSDDWKRFQAMLALFRRYGALYGFDPLMLAAQGYQESGLDQSVRSKAGAVGVMQLMPATGKSMQVGDIHVTEPNIHAGAKYMNQLMTVYFRDARFDAPNRSLFAFASYNAGPARIEQMRAEARRRKLDPDKWFNNVELVTAEKVGLETTTYVRNIYKYYSAYALMLEVERERRQAREAVAPAPR